MYIYTEITEIIHLWSSILTHLAGIGELKAYRNYSPAGVDARV